MPTHCNTTQHILNSQRARKSPFICVHVFQYAFIHSFIHPMRSLLWCVSLRFEKLTRKFVFVVLLEHHSLHEQQTTTPPKRKYGLNLIYTYIYRVREFELIQCSRSMSERYNIGDLISNKHFIVTRTQTMSESF